MQHVHRWEVPQKTMKQRVWVWVYIMSKIQKSFLIDNSYEEFFDSKNELEFIHMRPEQYINLTYTLKSIN